MRVLIFSIITVFGICGCSNIWHGVKEDTNSGVEWTKDKVNDGATWVKDKTE